ncbi:hypothetical protein [Neisseria weaveri]|uniref:Uncharacterized protein n=1 Tax=Neisseria weaveri TaxID=28091 RepID=A0A3S5CAS5_9NEIS|nr:hypothetical protein [Neisseria weaveri]EGV37893.1 hypothetical protein l11_08450 [Neisseria weaveri LMG 5135]VEJ51678.1 Uncharacterised protein [Neisseria weaveri]
MKLYAYTVRVRALSDSEVALVLEKASRCYDVGVYCADGGWFCPSAFPQETAFADVVLMQDNDGSMLNSILSVLGFADSVKMARQLTEFAEVLLDGQNRKTA